MLNLHVNCLIKARIIYMLIYAIGGVCVCVCV